MQTYDLLYDISGRTLSGVIAGKQLCIVADGSGGHAGAVNTKRAHKSPLMKDFANNPLMTGRKMGPLPACRYKMSAHHTTRHAGKNMTCIWLDPVASDLKHMHGRAGMLIHGEGHIGSEGCIVLKKADLSTLWNHVHKTPNLVLQVFGSDNSAKSCKA